MNELYKLRDMLCKELEEYGNKGEMSAGTLDVVDKLAHALKNLDKIIMYKEEDEGEYSGRGYPMGGSYRYSRDGGSYRGGNGGGSYNGGSYARGRGSNARRDSMGRYSSDGYSRHDGGMADEIRELMEEAPDNIKRDLQKVLDKIEQG